MTTLINLTTGWFRHASGGRDTSELAQAVWLTDKEVEEWKPAFRRTYRFATEAEARERALRMEEE